MSAVCFRLANWLCAMQARHREKRVMPWEAGPKKAKNALPWEARAAENSGECARAAAAQALEEEAEAARPVSYTHLTLPTKA